MMHDPTTIKFLVIIAVLLFFALSIAAMIIMDLKSHMPGSLIGDLFTTAGVRRDHPLTSFFTMSLLVIVIAALILSLLTTITGYFDFSQADKKSGLLEKISEERMVERTRHFHNEPLKDYAELGKKNVCFTCHGDYPHSKEPMIRTMMNMHTQFVSCMTCHIDPKKIPDERVAFEWLNYSGIEVEGQPFGTDVDPVSGYLVKTDDYFSKIVPYKIEGGNRELLELTEDSSEVQEFIAVKDVLSDRDRIAIKNRFHKLVSPKGRFCNRCHADEAKSYMPFKELGFSDRRVDDLTNLSIIGLVQKYKKFYMPNLLDSDKSLPNLEDRTGSIKKSSESQVKMKADPGAWWRETYDSPKTQPPN